MVTVPQAFDLALQHHQAGRLAEAEALYREILTLQPNHTDALHFIGVVFHQTGRYDLAIGLIGRSVGLNPNNPAAYGNLGEACRATGRLDEAIGRLSPGVCPATLRIRRPTTIWAMSCATKAGPAKPWRRIAARSS